MRNEVHIPEITSLPPKEPHSRPLLLGSAMDGQVREYHVTALRATAGVVNTAIVLAAAEGIVAASILYYIII